MESGPSEARDANHQKGLQIKTGFVVCRGAESWWGCSDSDSGLMIDSGSDSGFDAKYELNNILIVERVPAVQAKKDT